MVSTMPTLCSACIACWYRIDCRMSMPLQRFDDGIMSGHICYMYALRYVDDFFYLRYIFFIFISLIIFYSYLCISQSMHSLPLRYQDMGKYDVAARHGVAPWKQGMLCGLLAPWDIFVNCHSLQKSSNADNPEVVLGSLLRTTRQKLAQSLGNFA